MVAAEVFVAARAGAWWSREVVRGHEKIGRASPAGGPWVIVGFNARRMVSVEHLGTSAPDRPDQTGDGRGRLHAPLVVETPAVPIDRSEPGADRLIAEWLEIRRSVVAPVLARIAGGTTTPAAPAPPIPAPVTGDWAAIRAKAVEIAMGEMRRWGNGARNESTMESVITDYWRGSVGWLPKLEPGTSISRPAWSAVFVSWVMLKAGASPAFKPRGAHWLYVRDALDSGPAAPVRAFAPSEHRPRPGDIVVKWRKRSTDLETIRTASRKTTIRTHGDIVIEVTPSRLYAVGGNVSGSVKRRAYGLSADGFWSHPARVAIVAIGP
jgi:hypothetical protein